MSEIKTPGVSIEEIPKLPPSVAQVETAVPSFIGYTQKALENGQTLKLVPKKIMSLADYETYFGTAKKESIKLQDTVDKGLTLVNPNTKFLMYYSLQMYFANGGGPCYIVSVGDYANGVTKEDLKLGLDASALEEESTLVVFPDATSITEEEKFYALYQDALAQAGILKNRFVIMDTYLGESKSEQVVGGKAVNTIEYLRTKIAPNMQAAAYFPHLKTVLNYDFDETTTIVHAGLEPANSVTPFFSGAMAALGDLVAILETEVVKEEVSMDVLRDALVEAIAIGEIVNETADTKVVLTDVRNHLNTINNNGTVAILQIPDAVDALRVAIQDLEDKKGDADGKTLNALKLSNSVLYNQIKKEIDALKVVLPPSSTMAGIYGRVDGTKGVWKAPANTGLNNVTGTTEKISDKDQEGLNEHENGKSVNAIRTFTGKGTLVWGARTFDSQSTEWRYISVRRLFDMVEKSVQNATQKFIFEPNTASTWIRAKAMIENYLHQLWMSGALAGNTPEQAYYVHVGKQTTPPQAVVEGRMNIQIGLAAVRPAEFIVLNFSHKLQES